MTDSATPARSETGMSAERFAYLAEAYGGDIGRWPVHEQPAARHLLRATGPAVQRMLDEAAGLDAQLCAAGVEAPAVALRERVVSGAPSTAAAGGRRGRVSLWWSGVGALGLGFAGAAAGAFVISGALAAGVFAPSGPVALEGWMDGGAAFGANWASGPFSDGGEE